MRKQIVHNILHYFNYRQVNKISKKFVKCRDGDKNISNKPKVGMAVWVSIHSHNIKHNTTLVICCNSVNRKFKSNITKTTI